MIHIKISFDINVDIKYMIKLQLIVVYAVGKERRSTEFNVSYQGERNSLCTNVWWVVMY